MRNKYPGPCYRCSVTVEAGEGHFERHRGGWRLQHATCARKFRGTQTVSPKTEAQLKAPIDKLRK